MGEEPSSLGCAFYSANLLWRVAAQTRVILSVVKRSRSVRRKAPKVPIVDPEKDGNRWEENSRKDYFSVTPPAIKTRQSSWRGKNSCQLCKIKYKKIEGIETSLPPCSPEPARLNSSNPKYLPITRTQPPKPPLRNSSLPFFKQLRQLAFTANPSAPLPHFNFTRIDGTSFRWLVLAHSDEYGLHEFMDPIWGLLLQLCHVEPCVRHLVLAIAGLRQNIRNGSNSWDSLSIHNQRHIIRHYILAIRGLHNHLPGIRSGANTSNLEVSFVGSYLLTVLQLALRNKSGVYLWLRTGYRLLKHAFRVFGGEMHGHALPTTMRDIAWAFGRLDTRSVKTMGGTEIAIKC
ncbi:hypothetical protein BKA65DRAFT_173537 [Rhexocercosporidium sp. MPI-PUGE-AT-0058]|nr:hypothetical protein BKA65DRAFT_173537 [Rhexocercosporidium sp. MPI-PUGE-AT-0058]